MSQEKTVKADKTLDCYGLLCPMPIVRTAQELAKLEIGEVLEVIATDEGIKEDMPAWCKATGNEYLGITETNGEYRVFVKRLK